MLVAASYLVPSVISPEAERVALQLASPALVVKSRLRGPSVLDQRKTLEETMVALETAAAAKRYRKPHRKPRSTSRAAALVLAPGRPVTAKWCWYPSSGPFPTVENAKISLTPKRLL